MGKLNLPKRSAISLIALSVKYLAIALDKREYLVIIRDNFC